MKFVTDLIPALKTGCTVRSYEVLCVDRNKTRVSSGSTDTLRSGALKLFKGIELKGSIFVDVLLRCPGGSDGVTYKLVVTK